MKHFFLVALLNNNPIQFIYHSFEKIESGRVVTVVLKEKKISAVILRKTQEPPFKTLEILEKQELIFSPFQLKMAKFISTYYFCSYSEAINLFLPFPKDSAPKEPLDTNFNLPTLTQSQQKALNELQKHKRALLFGVTGSGKTEIYITKIAQTLKEDKSTLLLMPEIALTPQMEKRLKSYFGEIVAIWHSKLTKKQKEETLKRVQDGEVRVLAGARSALFLPLRDLGLIIVDEEHDDSYKSQRKPRYNAKDLAIYFAKELDIPIYLGSATPTLTSFVKYPVVRLKEPFIKSQKRYKFVGGDSITQEILNYIYQNFQKNQQGLIFVPTRANFKYLFCPSCGETHKCPFCSVGMSLNRKKRYVRCHYCNFTQPIPKACQECGYSPLSSNRVGTQEVIELIQEAIPKIKIEQFDKDSITTFSKLKKALDRVLKREVDLIVGTQMLSKGHDYPEITLSVIMGLDYLLGVADFRAKERAIALLHQIAGRSGRSKDATVIIQASQRENYLPYLKDYELFLEDEKLFREDLYPPFTKLARLLIINKSEQKAKDKTETLVEEIKRFQEVEIVGAGKAPVEKIANRFRYFILLRAKSATSLLRVIYKLDRDGVEVDMDPVDFS